MNVIFEKYIIVSVYIKSIVHLDWVWNTAESFRPFTNQWGWRNQVLIFKSECWHSGLAQFNKYKNVLNAILCSVNGEYYCIA